MTPEEFFAGIAAFFDDQFINILLATFGLFIIMFTTWWVYKKLSTRNIFQLFTKTEHKSHPTGWDHFTYILKFFFIFPILIFIGFLIFAFSLFLLVNPDAASQTSLLFIAIVIISTIRIGAYVNEGLAEDLAKLIPLSMLAIVLTSPEFSGVVITIEHSITFLKLIPGFLKYLLFTIILEALLRGGTWLFASLREEIKDAASAKQ